MRSSKLLTAAGAALVFVGCQFQASCGGKTLRMDRTKEFVATTLERETAQKPTEVTCPDKVKISKGTSFECTVLFGTAPAKVVLEQQDDEGFVKITSVTGILIATKLEAAIADQLGGKLNAHFTVACGDRVRPSTPGDRFTCTAKDAQGATGPVTVIVKDDQGNVRFDLGAPTGEAPAEAPAEGAGAAPADEAGSGAEPAAPAEPAEPAEPAAP